MTTYVDSTLDQPATQYRPLLFTIWLVASLTALALLEFHIHQRVESLRANGYSLWLATDYYTRDIPSHLLSLTQAQSQVWIIVTAILAGVSIATLASFFLAPDPVFIDLNRPGFRSGKPLFLRGRSSKLGLAVLLLFFTCITGAIGLLITNSITIDLDHKQIDGLPYADIETLPDADDADNFYLPLSAVSFFGIRLATSSSGKSTHWEVAAQLNDGHHFELLNIEMPFCDDQKVAFLISQELNSFVNSHGQSSLLH